MKTREDKRTTVSLARVVWKQAEEMMEAKGFNDNFSSYIADLIRRDKERHRPCDADRRKEISSSSEEKAAEGTAAAALNEVAGGSPPPPAPVAKPKAPADYKKAQRKLRKRKPKNGTA